MHHRAMNPSLPHRLLRTAAALALVLCALSAVAGRDATSDGAGRVDGAQITRLVESALLAQLRRQPAADGASRVELSVGALDSRLAFAPCAEPIAVAADLRRVQARVNARVSCAAPSPWAIQVPVELRLFRPVLVATRELQRGDTVGEQDIEQREHNVLAAGASPLVHAADVLGLQARRTIPAGSALLASLLEQPVLVRRGDRVSVDSAPGAISVRISGEAMGTARRGERVRVRNLQSGRIIDAVVTGSGTALAM